MKYFASLLVIALLWMPHELSSQSVGSGVALHNKTITRIVAYDDFVILRFSPAEPSQTMGCAKTNEVYLNMADENGKPMYAAALTAASSGKTVRLAVRYNVCNSLWDAATLYRIDVNF